MGSFVIIHWGIYNDLPELMDYIPLNRQKYPDRNVYHLKECEARHFALYKIFKVFCNAVLGTGWQNFFAIHFSHTYFYIYAGFYLTIFATPVKLPINKSFFQ